MLVELQPQELRQGELDFAADVQLEKGVGHVVREGEPVTQAQGRARLMTAVDAVNARFGRGSLKLAGAGLQRETPIWAMRQERRTPGYTTRWEEMPVVRA